MKKLLSSLTITSIILMGTISYAFSIGVEPPQSYMNNLRTCTPSTIKTKDGVVNEYTIKRRLPNGKCEVKLKSYTDFSDPEVYENAMGLLRAFGRDKVKESDIPTQAQMIKQGLDEAITYICEFTPEQRHALYSAYLKKDWPHSCITKPDGSKSCTFSTKTMSSYDKLMLNYQKSTCRYIEIKKPYKRRAMDKQNLQ